MARVTRPSQVCARAVSRLMLKPSTSLTPKVQIGGASCSTAPASNVPPYRVAACSETHQATCWSGRPSSKARSSTIRSLFRHSELFRGYGVNSGVARSGKVLRRILKLSDASSAITDAVVAAACATDAERLVKLICDERLRFLQSLRTWPVFGVGWGRRVADVRSAALRLAADGRTPLSASALMEGH